MALVWFNSISSQARINVLLIEPLLHQIKVLADGLACSLPSAMKGIISTPDPPESCHYTGSARQ